MKIAIRLEGTLTKPGSSDPAVGEAGEANPVMVTLAKQLAAEGHDLIILSSLTTTDRGTKIAITWLCGEEIPFADLWLAPGYPEHDLLIDFSAVTKVEDVEALLEQVK